MKKTLQSLGVAAALTFGVNANAQLPDYGIYPGGLMLDQFGPGGPIWDVDSILDSGTPVIIDLFAVWCGPCWDYHQDGILEDVYHSIGMGGSGDVFIAAVEADANEPEADMDGGGDSQGDWITGTPYPMINHNTIAGMFNLAYYPTLVLICPDRKVTEVGQVSAAAWETAVGNCGVEATATNDLRAVSNETVANTYVCGSGSVVINFEVGIQNYSTTTVTGSKTVNIMNGMTVVGTTNITVNLDPYEATGVVIPVTLAAGTYNYTAAITNVDDDVMNNTFATPTTITAATPVGTGDVVLHLTVDAYAAEVGLAMASGLPSYTSASSAYSAANGGSYPGLIDFYAIGTWPGNGSGQGTVHDIPWYGLTPGCYHFVMFDNFGDGMMGFNGIVGGTGTSQDGSLNLESESGFSQTYVPNYGSMGYYPFEVTTAGDGGFTGIEEVASIESASVYPNPSSDVTNIEFTIIENSEVNVQIVNTLGQTVYSNDMGDVIGAQKLQVNASELEAGMYLINIRVNGNVITKRFTVVK